MSAEPATLRTRRKVRWLDLVRPPGWWAFDGHGIQEGMAIYQWMVRTGAKYRGMNEVLSCKASCVNMTEPDPFGRQWKQQLRDRVHAAILETGVHAPVGKWREDHRVSVEHSRVLPISYYTNGGPESCEAAVEKRLDALFGVVGRTLAESHNPYHLRARTLVGVRLHVRPSVYEMELLYGYRSDLNGGSSWSIEIARGGPFLDFLVHAEAEVRRLLVPDSPTCFGVAVKRCDMPNCWRISGVVCEGDAS